MALDPDGYDCSICHVLMPVLAPTCGKPECDAEVNRRRDIATLEALKMSNNGPSVQYVEKLLAERNALKARVVLLESDIAGLRRQLQLRREQA